MKIAVLGAGAMGMLFGGYLSRAADVTLIDVDAARVDAVNREGISIAEPDGDAVICRPGAATGSAGMEPVDLVVVFVKAMYSQSALASIQSIIGPDTYVMSLQNGSGHEDVLLRFASRERVVLGATQHNSSVRGPSSIHHGGGGNTYLGLLTGETAPLAGVAEVFEAAGFAVTVSDNILRFIWNKMFLNVSGSVLTAILQVKLGYLVDDENAWFLVERLTREAVAVANAKGLAFDPDEVVASNRTLLENAREGLTSIYADIRDGRKTEVDTISGSVVRAAGQVGVAVPTHQCMVALVHALENRPKS